MEKESIIENRELLERQVFIDEVGRLILDTFPFDDTEKKNDFSEKIKMLVENVPSNDTEVLEEIKKILADLNNTHLSIRERGKTVPFILDKYIYHKAGEFWINEGGQPVKVLTVNDEPIVDVINKQLKNIGGGTIGWKIYRALEELMGSENSGSISLLVDDGGIQKVVEASFAPAGKPKEDERKEFVSSKIIEGNIGYLMIKSWLKRIEIEGKNIADLIDEEMTNLESAESLIIDVRDNSGGNNTLASRLARRFIKTPKVYTEAFIRRQGSDELEKNEFKIEPSEPQIDKPVVLLTGPKCLSSNELFILMLKDTGRAITIGETTGGGSGKPRSFNLTLGKKEYKINVPTWKLVRNNGQEIENVGIEPDIEVVPTPEDVIKNRDPVLEEAVSYLKAQIAHPITYQPLTTAKGE